MMKTVTVTIPDYLYEFYKKVGLGVKLPAERVMGEVLFRFAGGVSNEFLANKPEKPQASS